MREILKAVILMYGQWQDQLFDKQTFSQYPVEKKGKNTIGGCPISHYDQKQLDNLDYTNWVVTAKALTCICV